MLEPNSAIRIAELPKDAETAGLVSQTSEIGDPAIQVAEFRQLELTNLPNLIYGFTDEQLALAVSSVPTVTPPVAPPVAPPVVPPVVPPVKTPVVTPVMTPVMTPVGKPSETLIDAVQRKVLVALKGGDVMSTSELAEKVGISQPKDMRRRYLRLLLDMGLVEYTIPQKPNSRLQKYRLTDKGRSALVASVH